MATSDTDEGLVPRAFEGEEMIVMDFFAGLKGWSQAFSDRGHEVITIDIEEKFSPDLYIMDLRSIDLLEPNVILASPPCQCFSTLSAAHHWKSKGIPRTGKASRTSPGL